MIFFKKLEICEFFIEIEKYFGFYPENKRAIVFGFVAKLSDVERAALYNELIEGYPSDHSPPDVYRLNFFLQKAKQKLQNEQVLNNFEEKKEDSEDLAAVLKDTAMQYGLSPNDKHLFSKILFLKMRKNNKKDK